MSPGETALAALLADPTVDSRVKTLLEREYPPDEPSHAIFTEHSAAVAELAVHIAQSCGAQVDFVREAAWLHDIGIKYTRAPGIKCFGSEPYLRHGVIGGELCRAEGLVQHALVCERHVGTGLSAEEIEQQQLPLPKRDMLCQTVEERVVCFADKFFSKSSSERLSLQEATRRIARHGPPGLVRFQKMQAEFGWPAGSPPESA